MTRLLTAMSKSSKVSARIGSGVVEIKSKFDAEFRRFSVSRNGRLTFDDFINKLEQLHGLEKIPFYITYTDPEGDLLPINNNDNFLKALSTARPVLRVCVNRKGQSTWELNGFGSVPRRNKNPIIGKLIHESKATRPGIQISLPEDFRRVSAIIDVDIIPETHRRVRLMKNGSDKPLGFYIRDGTSVRVTAKGLEKVPGIFISRLVPGGLAESTGLLAVNDEVLEVNGIEVAGKTLDQVTDMMVANSSNLTITVKPVNQRNNISPRRRGQGAGSSGQTSLASTPRQSQKSRTSARSGGSGHGSMADEPVKDYEEHDEVRNYLLDVSTGSMTRAGALSGDSGLGGSGRHVRDLSHGSNRASSPVVTL